MVNLRSIFGGLVLATSVAFSGTNDLQFASTNDTSTAEMKTPYITSFRTFYTNDVQYVEVKGKTHNGSLKKYSLQSTTNLTLSSWEDLCSLDDCADSKKEEFVFTGASSEPSRFYRLKELK